MSIDAVNQFLEKVAQDSKIQEELAQAMEAEDDRQAVVELGAKHGFEFSGDELMAEVEKQQKAAVNSGELSQEELESVAGGSIAPTALTYTPTTMACLTDQLTDKLIPRVKW